MQFAKLFQNKKYGQIAIMINHGANMEPELRYYFVPPGYGVCSFGIVFEKSDEGWSNARDNFDLTDPKSAEDTLTANLTPQLEKAYKGESDEAK